MNLSRKNKHTILTLTVLLLIAIVLLFAWLQKRVIHSEVDLQATVYPLKLKAGDTLHFTDVTPFATQRVWSFGDGVTSMADSGIYRYSKAGYYQLKLVVNNRYTKVVNIQVEEPPRVIDVADSLVMIEAPKIGMQFENIVFRCKALDATAFRWKFGETSNIDSKEPVAIYAYQKPGDYTVQLYTNTTQYPIQYKIKILPAFKTVNDSISFDNTYQKIDDDFKLHLQQIANGVSFNQHYNYLLNTYLCHNEKAVIKINGSRVNDFNSYCLGLQFDKNTVIQTVKCGFDDKQKCVTKVEIQQGK